MEGLMEAGPEGRPPPWSPLRLPQGSMEGGVANGPLIDRRCFVTCVLRSVCVCVSECVIV
jgi:hypothetical protein